MDDSKKNGSGLKIGDEDIDWLIKSEGKGTRTIQYPVEQTGVRENLEDKPRFYPHITEAVTNQ
jgi:hypothetical protein